MFKTTEFESLMKGLGNADNLCNPTYMSKSNRLMTLCFDHDTLESDNILCTTGGGAHKYSEHIQGLDVNPRTSDEIHSLIKGIDFVIHADRHGCYFLTDYDIKTPGLKSEIHGPVSYPYLVVNIGSGVSIVKVTGPGVFERVGGISIGGGTFLGLSRLLVKEGNFKQFIEMAHAGDSDSVDLLVKDIYGGDYSAINLSGDTVASSFGKLARIQNIDGVKPEDAIRSLLVMITHIIASLANLYAKTMIDDRGLAILYVGSFLHNNDISKKPWDTQQTTGQKQRFLDCS